MGEVTTWMIGEGAHVSDPVFVVPVTTDFDLQIVGVLT
jgi:hypothetical protein